MNKKLSNDFLKKYAESRAKKIFTKEFFENCTDSWYYDEFFEFKSLKVGTKNRVPSDNEAYTYMGYMQEYKDKYYDDLFSSENVMSYYKSIINKIHDIMDIIEEGNKQAKAFECPNDITLKLKQVGNHFVDLYNQEYYIYKNTHKE